MARLVQPASTKARAVAFPMPAGDFALAVHFWLYVGRRAFTCPARSSDNSNAREKGALCHGSVEALQPRYRNGEEESGSGKWGDKEQKAITSTMALLESRLRSGGGKAPGSALPNDDSCTNPPTVLLANLNPRHALLIARAHPRSGTTDAYPHTKDNGHARNADATIRLSC